MRTRPIVRTGLVACAVAVTLVFAGCAKSDPALTAPPAELDSTALDLLTQSGSFHQHEYLLTAAEEVLVGRCMRNQGVAYPKEPPKADTRTDEERVLNLAERQRQGYGLSQPNGSNVPALDQYVRALPVAARTAFTRALFGADDQRRAIELPGTGPVSFPGNGCLHDAQAALFGDILTWARVTYVPEELNNKLAALATASPEYKQAMRRWSTCMNHRGYKYAEPAKVSEDFSARYEANGKSKELLQQEIKAAVADATCAQQVDIPDLVIHLKKSKAATLSVAELHSMSELAAVWSQAATTAEVVLNTTG
ncbi:hypothetical protein [Kribbella deserti]|uniref:Lipoprotein n=1 Tax=Kribbella deserti TaxID=1926257 RepID=A0ABV6QTB4_9ACTN